MNTASVGVALIGNFQTSAVPPAAVDALERLLAWKLNWHGVDPTRLVDYTTISGTDRWPAGSTHTLPFIVGHRDPGNTDCPGDHLYAPAPAIRASVAAPDPRRRRGPGQRPHGGAGRRPKVAVMSRFGRGVPGRGRARAPFGGDLAGLGRSHATWSCCRRVPAATPSTASAAPHRVRVRRHRSRRGPTSPASTSRATSCCGRAAEVGSSTAGAVSTSSAARPPCSAVRTSPGNDVARKLVHFAAGWYVLDAFGALHPVNGAPRPGDARTGRAGRSRVTSGANPSGAGGLHPRRLRRRESGGRCAEHRGRAVLRTRPGAWPRRAGRRQGLHVARGRSGRRVLRAPPRSRSRVPRGQEPRPSRRRGW